MPGGARVWAQTPRFGSGLLYEPFTAWPHFPQGVQRKAEWFRGKRPAYRLLLKGGEEE
jgi:hypothetical protein